MLAIDFLDICIFRNRLHPSHLFLLLWLVLYSDRIKLYFRSQLVDMVSYLLHLRIGILHFLTKSCTPLCLSGLILRFCEIVIYHISDLEYIEPLFIFACLSF